MANRRSQLFAGCVLACMLLLTQAHAAVVVTATQNSGARGDTGVGVSLNIAGNRDSNSPLSADTAAISSFTFNFLWDSSVLTLGSDANIATALPPETVLTKASGSLVLDWSDSTFVTPIDLSGGFQIHLLFNILGNAPLGNTFVRFGEVNPNSGSGFKSGLFSVDFDDQGNLLTPSFEYVDVTEGQQMRITVTAPQNVPEPGSLPLMLLCLAGMATALRMRVGRAR